MSYEIPRKETELVNRTATKCRNTDSEGKMDNLMTVDQVAEKLGVSRVFVYKLVREKKIPFYHIERCVRFSPVDIEKWLEERRVSGASGGNN